MRSKLRGAVDDMVTNGLTNSIKVPNKIENFKTRTLATTIGTATYSLHDAKKTVGVSTANIASINSAFDTSRNVDIGRVIGSVWDSINDKASSNDVFITLNFAKGISQMAQNLGHDDYKFDNFLGIWNGKYHEQIETVIATIEACPASLFSIAIGYINDLSTSCLGNWAGLGYISLDDAVNTLTPLLAAEIAIIAADTSSVVGNPNITGTTVKDILLGGSSAAEIILAQLGVEEASMANKEVISEAMATAISIQTVGVSPKDPLFNIFNESLYNEAKTVYDYAPNLIHTNSIMAPKPYETEDDTFFRVKKIAEFPTPSYNTADVLYKAAAFDPSIKTKYLQQNFDPRSRDDLIRVFDAVAKDFAINPCGGDRSLRLTLLRDHLDTLELNLLRDRIKDVRNMLTD